MDCTLDRDRLPHIYIFMYVDISHKTIELGAQTHHSHISLIRVVWGGVERDPPRGQVGPLLSFILLILTGHWPLRGYNCYFNREDSKLRYL
ncbi:hypothetical protein J6590_100176 [Homalodisca vitripennis]|nr:hypothetical protein J6590_100176 [Homalodisca vitripennis]